MEAFVECYEAIRLFGYEAIRLLVAHGTWSVNLVDFQQHLLFSLGPHIKVSILAFQSYVGMWPLRKTGGPPSYCLQVPHERYSNVSGLSGLEQPTCRDLN